VVLDLIKYDNDAHEQRRRDEHVLVIWLAQHVPDDQVGCFVS